MNKYTDELIEINDIVVFQTELFVEPDYLQTVLFMEVELLFSDLKELGGPTTWFQNCHLYEKKAQMKPIQKQTFQIRKSCMGLCQFVQVNFNE